MKNDYPLQEELLNPYILSEAMNYATAVTPSGDPADNVVGTLVSHIVTQSLLKEIEE